MSCYNSGGIRCSHITGDCNQGHEITHPVMNPEPEELVADLDWEPNTSKCKCELCVEIRNKHE